MKLIYLFCFIFILNIEWKFVSPYSLYDGETAAPYSAPYIVSIKRQTSEIEIPARHTCAGAILNEYWILTAADCILSFGITTIFAGEYNLTIDEGVEQFRTIAENITHENYNSIGFGPYDIALVRIEKPFQFNKFIQPILLPQFEANVTGAVTLYGWSSITNETNPKVLQTTTRELVSLDECRKFLDDRVHETNNFCMGPTDQDNEACVVDKGGPIVQDILGQPVLIGISSWRTMRCWPGPYVNVRVSAFIDWINTNMKK